MEIQLTDGSFGLPSHVPSMAVPKTEGGTDDEPFVGLASGSARSAVVDKDLLCPICMQRLRDAFLTACGHSFCYSCVSTHLATRQNCPCCGHFLTKDQLFPNFLLNKLLKKACASSLVTNASPTEHLRLALQQGAEVSVKELDFLLALLGEKKRKAEQEEAEVNMEILLDFLHRSCQQKRTELEELKSDLQFLREDISSVESRLHDLSRMRDRSSMNALRLTMEGPEASPDPMGCERPGGASGFLRFNNQGGAGGPGSLAAASKRKLLMGRGGLGLGGGGGGGWEGVSVKEEPGLFSEMGASEAAEGAAAAAVASVAANTIAKKRRVFAQFDDLQECYLQRRRKKVAQMRENNTGDDPRTGLDDFQTVLTAYTKYSRLKVIAELRHGDLFQTSNIVSSIEFDRDDELFATAGVSRRIKVFEYATVVNEMADVHCPVVEMSTRSKLSCLSWNKYVKAHIASSDYEGIVTVWDVNTRQSVMEYEEHEKRAWSVDFSRTEPTRLVSGSDDGKVKIWCTRQETSVLNIDMKANICCVKYNPGSANYVAVGSADHHIHYYDVRNPSVPLHVFSGHRKAVSYVKFISPTELASASTDSTLRLWDVQENCLIRTLKGHTNEKNFVGLSVNSEYIACGSETNEVFVYYKAMSKPAAWHRFSSPGADLIGGEDSDDDAAHFISAVCWKSESQTMLAANSQGTIKVLVMAP